MQVLCGFPALAILGGAIPAQSKAASMPLGVLRTLEDLDALDG